MKKLAKLAAAVALSSVILTAFANPALAQTVEQSQELNQNIKLNCTTTQTGSYGQSTTTCTAEGTQTGKQNQVVTINNEKYFAYVKNNVQYYQKVHKPVNTSVTTLTISGLIAAAATTAGAGFLTLKKSK